MNKSSTDQHTHGSKRTGSVSSNLMAITLFIVGGALTMTLGLGYFTTWKRMELESLQSLELLVKVRAESVSHQFTLAESNVVKLKDSLIKRVAELDTQLAKDEFHSYFQLDEDGLWRVRPQFNDFTNLPTLYLHDVPLSNSIYKRAVASYHLLKERGPALVPPFYSVYMDFVEKGLMVYSPALDWGGNATSETDNFNYPTMIGSKPENNPERQKFWTPVYLDEEADTWMVSVIEPLDIEEQWVGTLGHDVALTNLMEATLNDYMPGTYNIILSDEGQLIVHPKFTQSIEESKGELSLENVDDPFLNAMLRDISATNTDFGVLEDEGGDYFLGVGTVSGPQWRLVTVYPKSLIKQRVLKALITPVLVGFLILLTALLLSNLAFRWLIGRPLGQLDKSVSELSRTGTWCELIEDRKDEFGRLAESFKSMSDNLKLREKSLVSARQDWERTFDTVPEMISIISDNLIIQRCNKTFCTVHKSEFWQLVGLPRDSLVPAECRGLFSEKLELVKLTRLPVQFTQHHLSGSYEVGLTPLLNDTDKIIGIVEVTRDITRHKELEAQLLQSQKMEAIGHLAGGVAHDFNNLLQVIIGYCEILLMGSGKTEQDEEKKQKNIVRILDAATNAASLTSQLLTFSRNQDVQAEPVELSKIVSHTITMVKRLIEEHIVLEIHKCKEGLLVNASEVQIEQIILNLCVNARDAMPAGGVLKIETVKEVLDPVQVKTLDLPEAEAYARLTIADTGTGMDAQTLMHIFEPFFSTKEKDKGTGLGLATVYGIVKQHNGAIDVRSTPGKGTTFDVWLPLFVLSELPQVEVEREKEQKVSGTVLIAEDNEVNRNLFANILSDDGFTVISACDGAEAVSLFKAHQDDIDLVILDVIMPNMNGREAATAINALKPETPCLFASGYSEDMVKEESLQLGVNLIKKPFKRHQLLNTIYRMIRQSGE